MRNLFRLRLRARICRFVMLAFVAVAGLGMVTTSCATRSGSSGSTGGAAGGSAAENWAQPLPGGVATTVAGAQAVVDFPVSMPDDPPVASQMNLTQAWVDGHAGQVALVFDEGNTVIEMWTWPSYYPDPVTRFNQLLASISATAAIEQVAGQPALVIQPDTDAIQANRAWVEFDFNGVDVNISSDTYGTDALLQVADSLSTATTSPSPSPSSSSTATTSPSPSPSSS